MLLAEGQLSAMQVLRAFHRDEPYLILGAAFSTVSVLAIGVCAIRKRFDALLVSFAVFAFLYGARLWLNAELLRLTVPPSEFFDRLTACVDYLVPIPAFLFFQSAGFLGRYGKRIATVLVAYFAVLVLGTALIGDRHYFRIANNSMVIIAVSLMIIVLLLRRGDRDFAVVRVGLLTFGVLSLVQNILGPFRLEPYGFAVLLACLGYVAARRALKRDEELGEIQRELELARRIQLSLLPQALPDSVAFKVAAHYVPMSSVAGDLYEFLVADERRAGLLIADVSGHGVPAALIASMVKMAAISQRPEAAHPSIVLTGMNRALCGNTQGQYVTAAYAYLDAERGELRYAAAGHPAMLLLRDGQVFEVAENGLLLAVADSIEYTERTIPIRPGDRLVLYTDGIVEARNRAGVIFGDDALMAAVQTSASVPPDQAAADVIRQVQSWAPVQEDDLSILVCDYAGLQPASA